MLDPTKCAKRVYSGSFTGHMCTKPVWKDGFCKVHHPETVKSRNEKSDAAWKVKQENSPFARLQRRIVELEAQNAELTKRLNGQGL